MNLKDLSNPFAPDDIEWRMQQSGTNKKGPWGKCLAYVTNRAIMDRLDDVCGQENWENKYRKAPDGGILCGISILCGERWVTKWDGAQNTDIESVKGGLSNAMKRAAVQWGMGRYLYKLEVGWAVFSNNGKYTAKMKDNTFHKWDPPKLPSWALPSVKIPTQLEDAPEQGTPKNDDTFLPEQKDPMSNDQYLAKMKGFAQFESAAYKKVLAFWQIDSATKITSPEAQEQIIVQITEEIKGA